MRERVIAELEAVSFEPADDLRVPHDLAADDEERPRDLQAPERRGDARRPARVGPVVEGERDLLSGRLTTRRQPAAVPEQDRTRRLERTRCGAHGCRAAACRPRREALGGEQDDDRREQERDQRPPRGGTPRSGALSSGGWGLQPSSAARAAQASRPAAPAPAQRPARSSPQSSEPSTSPSPWSSGGASTSPSGPT